MINIVIPMAGLGKRFVEAGFPTPKPFIDVLGKPMIQHVLENLLVKEARFTLIARKEHLQKYGAAVRSLKEKFNASFITIDQLTEGTACTVLFAKRIIDNRVPLLVANSDQIVDFDCQRFIDDATERHLDGSILTFEDAELNPKWSFAKINEEGIVTEVREKNPISSHATAGIYYFVKGLDFVDGAVEMIINNDRVNNEFYTCPVYNYLIRAGKRIGIYNIAPSAMHGVGTPEDLHRYILSKKSSVIAP